MKNLQRYLLLFFIVLIKMMRGQAGAFDMDFTSKMDANIYSVVLQPDGKILIGGEFKYYDDYNVKRDRIARLNSDASLDSTFNPGSGANFAVQAIALQTDGKILIGGDFTTYNGNSRSRLARLNADGSLDMTFDIGTGTAPTTDNMNVIYSIAIQPDEKIIICGRFKSYNGVARKGIARLNPDGSIDSTFNPGTGLDYAKMVVLQKDGKILIGGWFTSYNGVGREKIARLNGDGSLDLTFDPKGIVYGISSQVRSIAVQDDGKILIGGIFDEYEGVFSKNITRLMSDGVLDSTFKPINLLTGSVRDVDIQSDGKILIGGYFDAYRGANKNVIARLNLDGSLDLAFSPGAGFSDDAVGTIVVQPDGKILVAGTFSKICGVNRKFIARIFGDDSFETSIKGTENRTINVFPNPCSGKLIIKTDNKIPENIQMVDITGKIVLRYQPINTASVLNMENFSDGIYFVQVNTGQTMEVMKVILQK